MCIGGGEGLVSDGISIGWGVKVLRWGDEEVIR